MGLGLRPSFLQGRACKWWRGWSGQVITWAAGRMHLESGHRGCPELVNTEILSEEWEKQHGTHTVEEPKIYSKHHIRFMSNILLLIIRKASVVTCM